MRVPLPLKWVPGETSQIRPEIAKTRRQYPHAGVPRVPYASGGQSYPNPPPYDQFSLDTKVRHMEDRVAIVAVETLGVSLENILVYASDTDMTPFDTGAYASSTTFISGGAVLKAAQDVWEQIISHAVKYLLPGADPERVWLEDERVWANDGRSVTLEETALHSIHQEEQHQIMATASHMSYASPPPFAAQYVEVEVDIETEQVEVTKLIMAVDCGVAINPVTAAGQVEGGVAQALGYAVCEEMVYDDQGRLLTTDLTDYRIYRADEMPELGVILVETYEPSGPYGAKAVAEIPKDGVAPAIASAIYNATGTRLRDLPFTPERVWRAIKG